MLTKAIPIGGKQGASLVKVEPLSSPLDYHLGAHQVGRLWAVRG